MNTRTGTNRSLRIEDLGPEVDRLRLDELRQAWGQAADEPLLAIGKLRGREISNGKKIFFLENLEHPRSATGFVYPEDVSGRPASAFVPPPEVSRLELDVSGAKEDIWAIAELELSSNREREKHKNPHKCDVRRGSLRLLRKLPEDWVPAVIGDESPRLISAAAMSVIEAEIKTEREKLQEELGVLQNETAEAGGTLNELRHAVAGEERKLMTLQEQSEREIALMETRVRRLNDLLDQKGRRLVALGLIDEDDLAVLLPSSGEHSEQPGYSFQSDFGGDFDRLAPFIQARLYARGMLFSQAQLRDVLALVRTHDLFVLAGDSGSGKTSLIKATAEALGGRCTIVPVKPNWTGPEDLLGYFNPIERSYQSTPFLEALQLAASEPHILHFIVLDEMNLARVEHYFADFLSLLENRETVPDITLYTSDEERHTVVSHGLFLAIEEEVRKRVGLPETATLEDLLKNEEANRLLHRLGGFEDAESILEHHARLRRAMAAQIHTPTSLTMPPNVRIVGAINIDETTYFLSPKVLDRIHVVRFRNPVLQDWSAIDAEVEEFDLDLELPLYLSPNELGFRTDYPRFDPSDPNTEFLVRMAREYLDPLGIEFGFRAIRQSLHYIDRARDVGVEPLEALNNVLLHKVLPKLVVDTTRQGPSGTKRAKLLSDLRDAVAEAMTELDPSTVPESCVVELDRVIAGVDGNNGIANYWLR